MQAIITIRILCMGPLMINDRCLCMIPLQTRNNLYQLVFVFETGLHEENQEGGGEARFQGRHHDCITYSE